MSDQPHVMLSPDGRNWKVYPQTTLDARLSVTAFRNIRSGESQNAPRYKEKVAALREVFASIEKNANLPTGSMYVRVEDQQGALYNSLFGWGLLVQGAGLLHSEVFSSASEEGKINKFESMLQRAQESAVDFAF